MYTYFILCLLLIFFTFPYRLNRAYRPSVKYMDLFAHPIMTILAQNVAFVTGSLLAVLLVLTVIQEDLLTAHNVLTFITLLGEYTNTTPSLSLPLLPLINI